MDSENKISNSEVIEFERNAGNITKRDATRQNYDVKQDYNY